MKEFNKTKNLEVKKVVSGKSNLQKKKAATLPVKVRNDLGVKCEKKPELQDRIKKLIVNKLLNKSCNK